MTKLLRNGQFGFLCIAAFASALLSRPATAQTFKTLYEFTGGLDGGGPWGTPLLSGTTLYSTAFNAGSSTAGRYGTIFQYFVNFSVGTYLYDFLGEPNDGSAPMAGLVTDGYGDFFGTTTQGGTNSYGTIYEISGFTEYVLYNFAGHDGKTPEGPLLMDAVGNLYGTTTNGGANDSGTVFAYSAFGSLVQLYSFGNSKYDGIAPACGLVFLKGLLYGVTTEGGQFGYGTIFSVNVKTKAETVLYSFQGKRRDGGTPVGGLVADGQGNLYGTASVGGSARGNTGDGVIFTWNIRNQQFSVVHTFVGPDGTQPLAALTPDGQGNFYGTTFAGGANGYGTVFKYNVAASTLTTIYSFANGTDGAYPYGGVALDALGNIYGAATQGGDHNWGTLFEIMP